MPREGSRDERVLARFDLLERPPAVLLSRGRADGRASRGSSDALRRRRRLGQGEALTRVVDAVLRRPEPDVAAVPDPRADLGDLELQLLEQLSPKRVVGLFAALDARPASPSAPGSPAARSDGGRRGRSDRGGSRAPTPGDDARHASELAEPVEPLVARARRRSPARSTAARRGACRRASAPARRARRAHRTRRGRPPCRRTRSTPARARARTAPAAPRWPAKSPRRRSDDPARRAIGRVRHAEAVVERLPLLVRREQRAA